MPFLKRQIMPRLMSVLNRNKSVLLLGPRQTGKTTLIKQIPSDFYISLVDPRTRIAYERDPARLIREVEALKEGKSLPLVVIDEVQKIPFLMDAIQELIDSGTAKFILTGSSARKLRRQGNVNLLPGRVITLHMDPLMVDELPHPLPHLENLLLYGSLPEIITAATNAIREEDLNSYVTTYLEEEVRAEALVRNMSSFSQFLKLAGIESGHISNFQNISNEIGVSNPTISGYYQILVDCLIAERIEPLTHSLTRKRLIKSPKFLLFDLGVRRIAAVEGSSFPEKYMGSLFEQWVGLELLHMLRLLPERTQLLYWRDADGVEVDWVIEHEGQYIPIEVKWTENPRPGDAKHIKTFLSEYPNTKRGYVVSRAAQKQKLMDQIYAINWQELASIFKNSNED